MWGHQILGSSHPKTHSTDIEVEMLFLCSMCAQQAQPRVVIKARQTALAERSKCELIEGKASSIKEESV